MKRMYIQPSLAIVTVRAPAVLCMSDPNGVQGDNGLGYGGIDKDGKLDPGIKPMRNLWDEEW